MTTMMRAITLLVLNRRAQAAVAVLAALVASLLLGPGEVAARPKGY
jgi:hypothetical protein